MSPHIIFSLLIVALPALAAMPQDRNASAVPKKGDTITVKGCLRGGAVEATDVDFGETPVPLADGTTFRLTGKDQLKDLKKKHDAHLVSVTGVLKSDLTPRADATAKIGNMRVGIGAPAANPASVEAGNRRVLPVLEVKSFEGVETPCGR